MNPFARYTLMRILLFGVVFGVLATLHVRGFILFAGAILISAALSYLLLSGPRQVLVDRIAERAARRAASPRKRDADSVVEDAQLDRGAGASADRPRPVSGEQERQQLGR